MKVSFRSVQLFVFLVSLLLNSAVGQYDIDLESSAIAEANEFMDELLELQLPKVLTEKTEEMISDFSVHIDKKLFAGFLPTHRAINAHFIRGKVSGFGAIKRKGDCKPTFAEGHDLVISCKLDIGSLKATFVSSVTGFSLIGTTAHRTVTYYFEGSILNFEAKQPINGSASPRITAFLVRTLQSRVDYEPVGFNVERDQLFREEIIRNIQPQMIRVVNGRLLRAMKDALAQHGVTIPEVRT